jgi:hypothetical protein
MRLFRPASNVDERRHQFRELDSSRGDDGSFEEGCGREESSRPCRPAKAADRALEHKLFGKYGPELCEIGEIDAVHDSHNRRRPPIYEHSGRGLNLRRLEPDRCGRNVPDSPLPVLPKNMERRYWQTSSNQSGCQLRPVGVQNEIEKIS